MGAVALLILLILLLLPHSFPALERCDSSSGCQCSSKCRSGPSSCFGVKQMKVAELPLDLLTADWRGNRLLASNTSHVLGAWRRALQHVPKCWPKLQAMLCTLAWPPCEAGVVVRPAEEMCLLTVRSCGILKDLFRKLPSFLECNKYKPQQECRNNTLSTVSYQKFENQLMKDNVTCRYPLVRTNYEKNWFLNIEECGYRCETPLFTSFQYQRARLVIPSLALACLFVNLFVCITFLLDWRNWSRYPRIIIFYIHCCFLFGCLGWLAQFLPSAYSDIVCRRDGTPRRAEPQLNSGESVTCSLVFALIYFTLMAVGSWFVLFLAAICPRLQPLPNPEPARRYGDTGDAEKLTRRTRKTRTPSRLVCHLLAWILPSVLTIICLTVGEIDGDPLFGICFVGHYNIAARVGLLFVPLCATTSAALLLLVRILGLHWLLLARAREFNQDSVECEGGRVAVTDLKRSRTSTSVFVGVVFAIFAYAVGIQLYLIINQSTWDKSVRGTILCEMRRDLGMSVGIYSTATWSDNERCQVEDRPNVGLLMIYVVCYFTANLALSSLVWDRRVLANWKRLGSRLTGKCLRRINGGYSASPRCDPSSAPSSHSLMEPSKPHGADTFSWWDLFPQTPAPGGPNAGEAPAPDSEGSELISSSRLEMASSKTTGHPGLAMSGSFPHPSPHFDYRRHRRSGSLSSARTTPTLGATDDGYGSKRSHRSSGRNGDRRPSRRPSSQRRHDRDIRRSMSDCSSASSAVQWRGSWGSVQSYNSYNPQRGVLEERYANWRVQTALNWSASVAPYFSHTGLPLNFAWQTPVGLPMGSGPSTPGYWGYPPMPLWPVYMVAPPIPPGHAKANGVQPGINPAANQTPARDDVTPGPSPETTAASAQGTGSRRRGRGSGPDSDDFDSEDEVESMNSDAFDSEDEVMSGQEEAGEETEGASSGE